MTTCAIVQASDNMARTVYSYSLYVLIVLLGDDKLQLHQQLCEAVMPTPVGEVLRGVSEQDCEDFYRHYLHDFVRLVQRCKHSKKREFETKEYEVRTTILWSVFSFFLFFQLLASALDALVHGDEYCTQDGNITLIHRIAALHIVYEKNRSQVLWFGQLVAYSPEVMIHLTKENICDKEEMVCHKNIRSFCLFVVNLSDSSSMCC